MTLGLVTNGAVTWKTSEDSVLLVHGYLQRQTMRVPSKLRTVPGLKLHSGVPRGVWGVQPPRNSEDIGGVLDRMSKKDRRLDFLL